MRQYNCVEVPYSDSEEQTSIAINETPSHKFSAKWENHAEYQDEDGAEQYLNKLEIDEDVNSEKDEEESKDILLYSGWKVSVAVSMLQVITDAIRHCHTGVALVDLLTLRTLHCPVPNQCASSLGLLMKFFMELKNPIKFHYNSMFCLTY